MIIRTGRLTWHVPNDGRIIELAHLRVAVMSDVLTGEVKEETIRLTIQKTLNAACAEAGIWPQARIVELELQVAEMHKQNEILRHKINTGEWPKAEVTA